MRSVEINGITVTLREAVFSVTIASVLVFAGFLISSMIEHGVNQRNLRYRQAARISDEAGFSLAMRTDVGDAFVDGVFHAVDTVSHEKLDGEWLQYTADHQRYTRHTRTETYTVTDSKGRVQTRTRTVVYWTWDTYKIEKDRSKRVSYMGVEFPCGKFDYSDVNRSYKTVSTGLMTRIEFSAVKPKFRASAFTTLKNGTVSDGTLLHENTSIDELFERCTTSYAVGLFWTAWTVLIVFAVVGFVAIDNRWIEDQPD